MLKVTNHLLGEESTLELSCDNRQCLV